MGTVEAAREAERSIVDVKTLQHTNEQLISTLDEVMKIQTEGSQKQLSILPRGRSRAWADRGRAEAEASGVEEADRPERPYGGSSRMPVRGRTLRRAYETISKDIGGSGADRGDDRRGHRDRPGAGEQRSGGPSGCWA